MKSEIMETEKVITYSEDPDECECDRCASGEVRHCPECMGEGPTDCPVCGDGDDDERGAVPLNEHETCTLRWCYVTDDDYNEDCTALELND